MQNKAPVPTSRPVTGRLLSDVKRGFLSSLSD